MLSFVFEVCVDLVAAAMGYPIRPEILHLGKGRIAPVAPKILPPKCLHR